MASSLGICQTFHPGVKKVVDGRRKVRVEVTDRDVHTGRGKHAHCAVAQACRRMFHLDGAIISRASAYLVKGTVATRYKIPTTLARELTAFDRGAEFVVGLYHLVPPSPVHRLGAKRNANNIGKRSGKVKKDRKHYTAKIRAILV